MTEEATAHNLPIVDGEVELDDGFMTRRRGGPGRPKGSSVRDPNKGWNPGPNPACGWWIDAIIDWEFANPGKSNKECAEHFERSAAWMSIIRNSSAFQERRAARRQVINSAIHEQIKTGVAELALVSIKEMTTRITQKDVYGEVEFKEVRQTAATALEAVGFGVKGQVPGPSGEHNVNIQINTGASKTALEEARDAVRERQQSQLREPRVLGHEGGGGSSGGSSVGSPGVVALPRPAADADSDDDGVEDLG